MLKRNKKVKSWSLGSLKRLASAHGALGALLLQSHLSESDIMYSLSLSGAKEGRERRRRGKEKEDR